MSEGRGERIVTVGDDEKRSWSTDYLLGVVRLYTRVIVGDGQAIDGDVLRYGRVARFGWRAAIVVHAIAGDIDHAP